MSNHSRYLTEVAILGCGAMGAAITLELVRRGHKVMTFEQFSPLHDRGSSHGRSRMIRKAYFEGDFYVPMLERSYELWRELNRRTGQHLFQQTGGLFIGSADTDLVAETLASAKAYDLQTERLGPAEVARRSPAIQLPEGFVAIYEEAAGILDPEKTWTYMVKEAQALGAEMRFGCKVREFRPEPHGFRIVTDGEEVFCRQLVLAAGSWTGKQLESLDLIPALIPSRRTLHWFQPENQKQFQPDLFPPNVWQEENGDIFYCFPLTPGDDGVKCGFHTAPAADVDPDSMSREVSKDEIGQILDKMKARIPALGSHLLRSKSCLYTMTADHHFAIGPLPGNPAIIMAAGFSGHGHKFAPVVGEIIGDLIEGGPSEFNLTHFDPARLFPGR